MDLAFDTSHNRGGFWWVVSFLLLFLCNIFGLNEQDQQAFYVQVDTHPYAALRKAVSTFLVQRLFLDWWTTNCYTRLNGMETFHEIEMYIRTNLCFDMRGFVEKRTGFVSALTWAIAWLRDIPHQLSRFTAQVKAGVNLFHIWWSYSGPKKESG